MPQLTDKEIANVAHQAGFRGQAAVTAVAVALAESGGRSEAVNRANNNGSRDDGLWQINSIHGYSPQSLHTPLVNAKAAFKISSGGSNWQPWVAFKNGNYRRFLDRAKKAVAGGTGLEDTPGFGETPPLLSDPLAGVTAILKDVGLGIVMVGGGLILVILGAYLIIKDQEWR